MIRHLLVLVGFCIFAQARQLPHPNAQMPDICNGKLYCFQKSNEYPDELIENIMTELNPKLVEGGNEIGDRKGSDKEDDDCERQINFEPIYEIVDDDNTVRYVVQSETTFLQKIRTESCMKPGRIEESSIFMPHELNQWSLSCHEKRIDYSFLVLAKDGSGFENVKVKGGLPVCCSCRLENNTKK